MSYRSLLLKLLLVTATLHFVSLPASGTNDKTTPSQTNWQTTQSKGNLPKNLVRDAFEEISGLEPASGKVDALANAIKSGSLTSTEWLLLWELFRIRLDQHPRLIYNNGVKLPPSYSGFGISNEDYVGFMHPPAGRGDFLIGFGTTVNFNIAAARKVNAYIGADQSPEVLMMLSSFFRTMFIISPTPQEWVSHVVGIPTESGEIVDEIFERIRNGEKADRKYFDIIDSKLMASVSEGKISQYDRLFCLSVLNDQISEKNWDIEKAITGKSSHFFKNLVHSDNLGHWLVQLYDPTRYFNWFKDTMKPDDPELEYLSEHNMAIRQHYGKSTFLLMGERYNHLRELYLNEKDFYALGALEDPKLWRSLKSTVSGLSGHLTDLYLSNIPTLIRQRYILENKPATEYDTQLDEWVRSMPHTNPILYETAINPPLAVTPIAMGGLEYQTFVKNSQEVAKAEAERLKAAIEEWKRHQSSMFCIRIFR